MNRFLAILVLQAFLLALCPCAAAETQNAPTLRALIVTCDRFVSQENTTPAAQENALLMAALLGEDARGYAAIRTECDTIATVDAFREAVVGAFAGAADGDISLLYISTHGVYNPALSNLTAELLLSDGETEEGLTPQMLESILAEVPGTHVVLMDACHSGAFIGKGLSDRPDVTPLTGDTKVLCSAGGSEESWYWRSGDSGALHGAGYFTSILAQGCGRMSGYPADENGDGRITLREAFLWLRGHYAVSTAQVYPEEDGGFTLFACGPAPEVSGLTDVAFEEAVFAGGTDQLRFSFTLGQTMRVAYQLVYLRRGVWDFPNAAQIAEPAPLEPGVYERALTLHLADEAEDVSGYMMLQIFSLDGEVPTLHESRLISVLPLSGDIALSVECPMAFMTGAGAELPVTVRHDLPCVLTVLIQNARGETVRYLAYEQQSRPQRLVPEGTCLYWDGLLPGGEAAPAGYYLIRVQTEIGGVTYQAYSPLFRLLPGESAG